MAGFGLTTQDQENSMELETDCEICNGTGERLVDWENRKPYKRNCYNCKQGKVPTELGQKILDFLSRHVDFEGELSGLRRDFNCEINEIKYGKDYH